MNQYPEHDKLRAIKDESQAIGRFLDWLHEEHNVEFLRDRRNEWLRDAQGRDINRIEALLADYFDIDLDKIEAERRAMLQELQDGYDRAAAKGQTTQSVASAAQTQAGV